MIHVSSLAPSISGVQAAPGRAVQSVAEASFDAWVKYYRADENTPNATISYYTKGALVALCFDLSLRRQTAGDVSLDDAMRALWRRCAGGPMSEADFAAVLEELAGRSFARELAVWVHGTGELPLAELLDAHGVAVHEEPSQLAQRLGLRVAETAGAIVVKTVLRGAAAERAGIAPGDEWLGVEACAEQNSGDGAGWRLRKLDDLPLYAGSAGSVVALVARDARLLRLPLALPPNETTWRLSLRDAARARPWLSGEKN